MEKYVIEPDVFIEKRLKKANLWCLWWPFLLCLSTDRAHIAILLALCSQNSQLHPLWKKMTPSMTYDLFVKSYCISHVAPKFLILMLGLVINYFIKREQNAYLIKVPEREMQLNWLDLMLLWKHRNLADFHVNRYANIFLL